ncbi:MAG TPA: ABC transporter substrate-binding protein [Gemmataceae bacterium]|nr:ABC transporter substrate-binding protein [Gemmataceae bacterium]
MRALAVLTSLLALAAGAALVGCSSNTGTAAKGSSSTPSAAAASPTAAAAGPPLTIAYSDWPGWLVWEIGIEKGFFKEAGVDVKFEWFEYLPSIDAFTNKKVDAVNIVCGDSLTAARGSTAIVLTDYSNGNDMIIAKKGIESIKGLKGKKVGLELNVVEHILLDKALRDNGMTEEELKLENIETNKTPQALSSGGVDAIGAWYPISGETLAKMAGSKPLYTSAQSPGLIYDALQVSPESLLLRRDDWKKVVGVWFRCLEYLHDPKTHDEAVKIMTKRIGSVKPEDLEKNLKGTKLLDRAGNLRALEKRDTLDSVYGSIMNANAFYLKHVKDYKSQDADKYVDASLVKEVGETK